jgi:Protein of unknown function (DUF3149)
MSVNAQAGRLISDNRSISRRVSDTVHADFPAEYTMHALRDFFSTDYGLMSAAVIAFTLGMGIFFARYMARHIKQDGEAAARAPKP